MVGKVNHCEMRGVVIGIEISETSYHLEFVEKR
jgi:uncharacterized protein YuzE